MDTQEQQTAVQSPVFSDEHVPAARHAYTWALLNLVIFWVIDMAVKIVLSKVVPKDVPEFVSQIITFAPMYLIAFPVYLLLSKRLTATVPEKHKMNVGQILLAATCAEFLGIAGNIIGTIVNFALTLLLGHRTDETFLAEGVFGSSSILFVLTAVVIAPVIEEMMFRKILIDRIHKYGDTAAILISGFMFGLFHGNFTQFFYAAAVGMLFAFIYVQTGKIIHTIVLHMLLNFWGSAMPLILMHSIDKDVLLDVFVNRNMNAVLSNLSQFAPLFVMGFCNLLIAAAGLIVLIVNIKKIKVDPPIAPLPKSKRFPTAVLNLGFILLFAVCVFDIIRQIGLI